MKSVIFDKMLHAHRKQHNSTIVEKAKPVSTKLSHKCESRLNEPNQNTSAGSTDTNTVNDVVTYSSIKQAEIIEEPLGENNDSDPADAMDPSDGEFDMDLICQTCSDDGDNNFDMGCMSGDCGINEEETEAPLEPTHSITK